MMYETYCLGDVCTFIDYRGKTPPKTTSGIPLVTAKIVKNGMIQEPQEFIAKNYYDVWMRRGIPQKGSVIFTTEAPLGEVARIRTDDKLAFAQRIIVLEPKTQQLNSDYLFYALQDRVLKNRIEARATGTTVIGIKAAELKKVEIDLPPLEEQKKIAMVLCSLDDKIELNNKVNDNLEQQAQSIFTDWLKEHEASSRIVRLGEVCQKITDGSHFSPKDAPKSNIPMLSVKDMEEYDFNLTSCKHITHEDYQKMIDNDCVPLVDDILVAKDGSYLKEIFICNEHRHLAILSSIAIFRPDRSIITPEILLAFLKSPRVLQEVRDNYVSGSALPRIVLKDFKKLEFSLPSLKYQSEITPLLSVIRAQIANNVVENQRLASLRDNLLPRLMSGEIDVSAIQI